MRPYQPTCDTRELHALLSRKHFEGETADPEAARSADTPLAAAFNLSKVILGAGGFAMPWAFRYTGLVGGPLAVLAAAAVGSFVMSDLVRVKERVTHARRGASIHGHITYVEAAQHCFGTPGAVLTYVMSLACSLGVCSAYLVFVAETAEAMLPTDLVSKDALLLVTASAVLPVTWLKRFSFLSIFARWGVVAVVLGYLVTLIYAWNHPPPGPTSYVLFGNLAGFIHVFGSIAFLFCVHFLIFPIHSALEPKDSFSGVQRTVFVLCAAVNTLFGIVGYLQFGNTVGSIVLQNLGAGVFLQATRLCLCIDLVCSYPLVFAAGREIVETTVLARFFAQRTLNFAWPRMLIRTALVAITWLFAQAKNFGALITVVGGVSQVCLAFILPPIMALHLFGTEMSGHRWFLSVLVATLGMCIAALTLATSLGLDLGDASL